MHYRYVDIVRGIAAFSILIWHYQHFFYPAAGIPPPLMLREHLPFYDWLFPFYRHGGNAVQLFWVLSGFVFAVVYIERPVTGWTFFVNRFARLYPLHLATLALVALLQIVSLNTLGHYQIYGHNDAYHFFLNLFMVQKWGFEAGYSFNAPTWSVSVEIAIYAFFFHTLLLLRRASLLGGLLLVAISYTLQMITTPGNFIECAMFFYLGTSCYAIVRRSPLFAMALGSHALVVFLVLRWIDGQGALARHEMIALFSGIVLIAAASDRLRPIHSNRYDWFGNATYGTYLVHVPIQMAFLVTVQNNEWDQNTIAGQGACLVSFVTLAFAIGVAIHKWFELPLKQSIKSFLLGPGPEESSRLHQAR